MKTETKIILGVVIITVIILVGGVFLLSKSAATVASPGIGASALDFDLPSTTGQNIKLSDYRGRKNVLLYFHEGLTCDPCIQQITELERSLDEFEKLDVEVLAISEGDSIKDLKKARNRFGIKKIPLLSYINANTEVDYDLTRFSMGMGRRAGHTFILVDKNGKIVWRKDYWPGYGMMVAGGTMSVSSTEILSEVKKALNK